MTTPAEAPEGLDLSSVSPGSTIDIETVNRQYRIECLGGDLIRICGHPDFCPSPASALLRGSLDDDGTVEGGRIGPGKRLMYFLEDRGPVSTSKVVSVHVESPAVR